jgi:hypothetical protein
MIDKWVELAVGKVVDPRLLPGVMDLSFRHFEKINDAAGCRKTAEMWEQLKRTDPESFYKAGCFRALTAAVLHAAGKFAAAAQEADLATGWLKQAVAAGFNDAARLRKDKDLDYLRTREPFEKLVASLEHANKRAKGKP